MWREIEELRQATVGQLRSKYLELFGQPSRSNHKQFLFRRVAWRLQALAYGELSEQARQRARALAQDVDLRLKAPRHLVGAGQQLLQPTLQSRRKLGRDERLPAAGTMLRREFKGQLVVVQVLADGFQYQDRFYRSLSSIARQVTGTPWNGYDCAIYTRKSTEEGLTQPFNSLDAQRESAEAYILSQREAGWTALADRYDDGGYTGANLERPALRRLLTDVAASRIDCVVVYKVDRLSRSLLDFARLMGEFDKRGISLVSVTQQFNTTASLGRLTLNILLSFAQFERELIAERTRDKMAAARRKGKWVGGIPVLGYDVAAGGGELVINEEEARQVRAIFSFFLEYRALPPVLEQIERRKWTTKTWTTKAGKLRIGRSFAKQDLTALLKNVIYTGKVHHQGQSYAGEHTAIVEEQVWRRVQDLLQDKRRWIGRVHQRARLPIDETAQRVETSPEGVPRIARLLALALKFEELIHQGVVKDYAELARLGRVSRARVTQVMNLLNLAPDIQERILSPRTPAVGLRESTVRKLSSVVQWSEQRDRWQELCRVASVHERPALRFLSRPATQP